MTRVAQKFIIGIDEVGRGPLAGPVAVGAVLATPLILRKFRGVKDSKQLTPKAREKWAEKILAACGAELKCAVAFVPASEIDAIGIAAAIRKAIVECLKSLAADPRACTVLLDGGLKAPPEYADQETIIRGDESKPIIGMASIVAKVERDRYMTTLDRVHPLYGFARHKGYGTKAHCAAIRLHGLTPEHRKSFCRSFGGES